MIHYALTPLLTANCTKEQEATIKEVTRLLGLTFVAQPYEEAVVAISKLKGVKQVTVTCVHESHVGIWEKGKKR